MSTHAKFGPSAADRWMVCTASNGLIERRIDSGELTPDGSSSVYADEGTAAHQLREDCLLIGGDATDFVGQAIRVGTMDFQIDDELAACIQPGIDWLREMLDNIDIEIKVRLDSWLPNQYGTMDSGGVFGNTLLVCDYKHGKGVDVAAVNNRQMRWYALGYWQHLGRPAVKQVLMVIDQPRSGGMKFWEIPLAELLEFGQDGAEAFLKIQTGNVEFHPDTKACRWCAAKYAGPGCPAYNAKMLDIIGTNPTSEALPDPEDMAPELRWKIVQNATELRAWLASLHDSSLEAAINGTPDPGSKAVIGRRGARFFTDAVKAEALLVATIGDASYKPKAVIGITEIEKLVKPGTRKKGFPDLWDSLTDILNQSDGKPILVTEDDPRSAVLPYSDIFDDL